MNVELHKIVEDMPNEVYHAQKEYISSSFVKKVYTHSIYQALQGIPTSQALIEGDLFHTACEDDGINKLKERVHVWDSDALIADIMERRPELQRPEMTSEYKNKKADVEQEHSDKIVVTPSEFTMYKEMAESAKGNEKHIELASECSDVREEVSYFGVDTMSGVKVRCRPDKEFLYFDGQLAYIVDWKSVGSDEKKSLDRKFTGQFWNFAYHLQAVFYSHMLGLDPRNFYFIAVSKGEPYESQAYALSDDTIDKAELALDATMAKIAEYQQTGNLHPDKNDLILL